MQSIKLLPSSISHSAHVFAGSQYESYNHLRPVGVDSFPSLFRLLLMSTSCDIQRIINLMPFIIRPIYTILSDACSYYIYSKKDAHADTLIKITQSGLLICLKYNPIPGKGTGYKPAEKECSLFGVPGQFGHTPQF